MALLRLLRRWNDDGVSRTAEYDLDAPSLARPAEANADLSLDQLEVASIGPLARQLRACVDLGGSCVRIVASSPPDPTRIEVCVPASEAMTVYPPMSPPPTPFDWRSVGLADHADASIAQIARYDDAGFVDPTNAPRQTWFETERLPARLGYDLLASLRRKLKLGEGEVWAEFAIRRHRRRIPCAAYAFGLLELRLYLDVRPPRTEPGVST